MQDETMDIMNVSNKIQDVFTFYMLFDFLDAVALAWAIYFIVKTIFVLSTVHPSNYFWTIFLEDLISVLSVLMATLFWSAP